MNISVIASSSRGNCYSVSDGTTTILIECGISFARIQQALNFSLSGVSACLVSHEHQDHCKAIRDVMGAGVDCYASSGTLNALGVADQHRAKIVREKMQFKIGTFFVVPFSTVHDAAEPLGFLVANGDHKLLFATDTACINHRFKGITHLMIECNYQDEIMRDRLKSGCMSEAQKNRLLFSHLSLDTLVDFLGKNDTSKLEEIHLLHLSDGNANEAAIKRKIMGITGKPVYVAAA